jgi:hypothetical protein
MTPESAANTGLGRRLGIGLATLACAAGASWVSLCGAQAPASAPVAAPKTVVAEQGAGWSELKPAQQNALRPLQQEWSGIDLRQKQKWLALSNRFQKLPPDEQQRIQARMSEWAKLSTRQRAEARMNYQEARLLPREDREARWKAYQALSPEAREQLAARAAASNRAPVRGSAGKPGAEYSAHPRPIGAIVVQAAPGATTTLLTRRPTPPDHQQTGMPKIAATPEFVNRSTLLPQRGPQGAATRSAVAPAPPSSPRK